MDHGCCFTCGRTLTPRLADIDNTKNESIFGMFDGFAGYMSADVVEHCIESLRNISKAEIASMLKRIPKEWDVSDNTIKAWNTLIYQRARFLADNVVDLLEAKLGRGLE